MDEDAEGGDGEGREPGEGFAAVEPAEQGDGRQSHQGSDDEGVGEVAVVVEVGDGAEGESDDIGVGDVRAEDEQ